MNPQPPLRLILDEAALVRNWRKLNALSGRARAGAAVKANAYGLGARRVVGSLAAAGCRDFFVAYASEAFELLDLLDPGRVSILHGPQSLEEARWIAAAGFKPVINSLRQAQWWNTAGAGPCDIMVDTGINRLGLDLDQLSAHDIVALNIQTVLSHLASAEEDTAFNQAQQRRWTIACNAVGRGERSLANSAGIMLGKEYHGDLTRPGIALYGGIACGALETEICQVAYPQAAIMQVRQVKAGAGVGYNSTFIAPQDMRVGIVALGYADGYLRSWSGKGAMSSGDQQLTVLGRVSMDMTVIDLSAAPDLMEGDWVSVQYSLPQASAETGLSHYELLTLMGRRFSRTTRTA